MNSATPGNPFPGLRPFRTEEYHLFFGREEQTAALLHRLEQERFLAVVGTSGSGKSSLVRAGLIPALHGGTMSRAGSSWEVVVLRPGGNPITSLAKALLAADLYDAADPEALRSLRATLTRSIYGLVEAVRQSPALGAKTKLLVVVDQFEELFRFRDQGVDSEAAANAFVNLLLAAAGSEERRLYIVITMRSDYLGECAQIPGLAEAVNRGEYLIPRLSRDQRRDAIEKPVDVGGARIAPRLVQQMLNELGDEADLLPVLQHALLRTWDAWVADHADGEQLDLRHYEATGGMREALSRHADEIHVALPAEVSSRVFKALTVKGADNRGIRRPTRLSRLVGITGASDEAVRSVIEAYRRQGVTFLMPGTSTELGPETVIDLSHESLMRVWSRLRAWVEEEAQSARVYRRLAETAALEARREAGLYHDPDLQIALSWRDESRPNEGWAEQYGGGFPAAMTFLDRSREAARAEERAREAAGRRELEQARALAEAERQRAEERQGAARRMRVLAAAAAIVAAVAVALYFVAVGARREAVESARAATELAARLKATAVASDFKIGVDGIESGAGSTGLAHLARALRTDPGYGPAAARTMTALSSGQFSFESLETIAQERVITSHDPNLKEDLVFTSDREALDTTAQRFVWDLRTGRKLYEVGGGLVGGIAMSWSPDGARFILLHRAAVRVLESRSGREVLSISLPRFSPRLEPGQNPEQGRMALFQYDDASVQLWSIDTGKALTAAITRNSTDMENFLFSPDHRRFAIVYRDRTVAVHDTNGGKKVAEIAAAPPGVRLDKVQFAPRGDFIVAEIDDSRRADWWPIPGPEGPAASGGKESEAGDGPPARPPALEARAIWLLPSGDRIALQGSDPVTRNLLVTVHDLGTRKPTAVFDGGRQISRIVHLEDERGRLRMPLLGAVDGNRVRIWDLETGATVQEIITGSIIDQAIFSPDSRRIATVSVDRQVILWDIFTRQRVFPRPIEHGGRVTLAFSPDGAKLVTHDAERQIFQVWDARRGTRIGEPIPLVQVTEIHFTSRGDRFVLKDEMSTLTTGARLTKQTVGRLRVFDIGMRPAIPEPLFDGLGHSSAVRFTPDGRRLVAGGILNAAEGYRISIIDPDSRRILRSIPLPAGVGGVAKTIRVTPDSRRVVLGCGDDPVRVWDIESGELVHQLPPHEGASTVVAISRDGALLATGSARGKLRVFDLATGALLFEPLDQRLEVDDVAFSPDGRLLASATFELRLHLLEARTGKAIAEPVALNGFPGGLAFSPDGSHIAVAPFAPEVLILEAGSGKIARKLLQADSCRSLAFSPDGRILAVGQGVSLDEPVGEVALWDWREGRKIGQPLRTGGAVNLLEFTRNGAFLATGTSLNRGGAVQVWDVASGRPLIEPLVEASPMETLSFRPDGTSLAASWEAGAARTIDLPPGGGAPGWLPRLAEAVAGERLVASLGGSEEVPRAEIETLRSELGAEKGGPSPSSEAPRSGSHERWGRWLLADPETRPISPGSPMSFAEYLDRARRSGRLEELEEALRMAPTDGLVNGRMGIVLLDVLPTRAGLDEAQRQHWRRVAAWYGARAVEFSPQDPEAWAMRVKVLQDLGREAEAASAIARALELDRARGGPPSANVHLLEALRLAGAGKWPDADREVVTALEALERAGPGGSGRESGAPLLGALYSLTPFHPSASFREVRLPEPIPGTFEDFDSIAEGTLPAGWTATHEVEPRVSSLGTIPPTLGTTASEAFIDWTCISGARVGAWSAQENATDFRNWMQRTVLLGRLNGVPVLETLSGGYLAAFVSSGSTARFQSVVTRDFDCSGRKNVHAAFLSALRQLPGGMASLQYSIDGGASWLPGAYYIDFADIVRDPAGRMDAVATLRKERETIPRFLDERGSYRGSSFAAFLSSPPEPGLASVIVGRLDDWREDARHIEILRLPRADGQPRVRLRFSFLGSRRAFWCIDRLGLHEGADVAAAKPEEVLPRGADPRVLARVGWDLLAGSTLDSREYQVLRAPDLLRTPTQFPLAAPGSRGPDASSGAAPAGDSLAVRRRALEARLLLLRASLLAPGDPDILLAAAVAAARMGDGDESLALARKALGRRGLERSSARSLATVFAARADALEKKSDAPGASLALELAFTLSQASGEGATGELFARLDSAGLLGARETFLPRGSTWRYFDRGSAPGSVWKAPEFDDADWRSGRGRLGYGGDGEVTVLGYGGNTQNKFPSAYFRAAFQVPDPGRFQHLRLRIARDDGLVLYLNGEEILRDNMPAGEITFRTLASSTIDNERENEITEILVSTRFLRPGRNVIAAEVHQSVLDSSDLGFDLEVEGVGRLLEPALEAPALSALEEGLDLSPELRAALWVSRAGRYRLAGKLGEAGEALRRAAGFAREAGSVAGWGQSAIAHEEAMLQAARGEEESAYRSYMKVVEEAIALKAGSRGGPTIFLPRTVASPIEPLIAASARGLAYASRELGGVPGGLGEREAFWLLRRSVELDPTGTDAVRARAEAHLRLRRFEAALDDLEGLDAALAQGQPATPRLWRERMEALRLRESALEALGRADEARGVRETIYRAPPRPPDLSPRLIDLSAHYNASLYDGRGWHSWAENCLAMLPETFVAMGAAGEAGIRFDLRGLIQLDSGEYPNGLDLNAQGHTYPDAVKGIPVGLEAKALHFLVSAINTNTSYCPAGTEVARLVIHSADGTSDEVPLRIREDLVDWALWREEKLDPARVGWKNLQVNRHLSLKTWRNPHPEKTIVSFDFISGKKPAGPFLVAATAE